MAVSEAMSVVSTLTLTQPEADALIALAKHRVDATAWDYPDLGGGVSVPLVSADGREQFLLDIRRGRIDLAKGTYQNRGRQAIVLVRLDFGGAPHQNPDGKDVESPHLHLYREGYGDKWAVPVPSESFGNMTDPWQALQDFMRYCNVVNPPVIRIGLFI